MSVTMGGIIGSVIPRRPPIQQKFVNDVPTLKPTNRRWEQWKLIALGISISLFGSVLMVIAGLSHMRNAAPAIDPATAAMLKHVQSFGVLCPTAAMTAEEQQQWVSFVAAKGYTAYPAAGAGCVDP